VNTLQKRVLAWAAFQAGVQNGGDSSPADSDYEEIQRSIVVAFDHWWKRYLKDRSSP
jgi:hypothetical protein